MALEAEPGLLVRSVGSNGPWASPVMRSYDDEDHLQQIVAADPQQVPGVPEGAWTVRELPTAAGPADVCIVASDGALTVVECKLASNSERRRMVIGQILDYAAAICEAGPTAFRQQWTRRGGVELTDVLDESAREGLDRNIVEGRIHLCLAVDRIDVDLRRLVEYLNRITRDDVGVTALQLTYARHEDVEILLPTTYGGEIVAAKTRPAARAEVWTKDNFLHALTDDNDRRRAVRLFEMHDALDERLGTHEELWFGTRPRGGIYFHPYGLRYAPIALSATVSGQLRVWGLWNQYTQVQSHPGFADLAALAGLDHRSGAPGFALDGLDLDEFWRVVLDCARAVNGVVGRPGPTPSAGRH